MRHHTRSTRLAHERAATHYGVPFLAYADLVPAGKCTGERLDSMLQRASHMPYHATKAPIYDCA